MQRAFPLRAIGTVDWPGYCFHLYTRRRFQSFIDHVSQLHKQPLLVLIFIFSRSFFFTFPSLKYTRSLISKLGALPVCETTGANQFPHHGLSCQSARVASLSLFEKCRSRSEGALLYIYRHDNILVQTIIWNHSKLLLVYIFAFQAK